MCKPSDEQFIICYVQTKVMYCVFFSTEKKGMYYVAFS